MVIPVVAEVGGGRIHLHLLLPLHMHLLEQLRQVGVNWCLLHGFGSEDADDLLERVELIGPSVVQPPLDYLADSMRHRLDRIRFKFARLGVAEALVARHIDAPLIDPALAAGVCMLNASDPKVAELGTRMARTVAFREIDRWTRTFGHGLPGGATAARVGVVLGAAEGGALEL